MTTMIKIKKMLPILLPLTLAIIALVVIIASVITNSKTSTNDNKLTTISNSDNYSLEKWQEGDVHYNDKVYRYNTSIKTYLIMGIDVSGPVTKAADGISGGQSDAMFLVVCDHGNKKLSVVAINRNTMTGVDVYDEGGSFKGNFELQICLQHAYGDGMRISCQRSVETVSHLFYDIPISGYLALNMDGISILNDAVGGVTLQVLQDISSSALNIELHEGDTVTLTGDEAYLYLRNRDTSVYGSADDRLNRQVQYIEALFKQINSAYGGDNEEALNIYNSVSDYIVSNIDFAKLSEELSEYGVDGANIYTVKGETTHESTFEEYHIDEDALYEMILKVFYNEVE
jgi:LCP family protein required for cell wall assembly